MIFLKIFKKKLYFDRLQNQLVEILFLVQQFIIFFEIRW